MDPRYAVFRNNGSSEAWIALAALARALNIRMDVLQIALNGAFDLLEITGGNPILALQVTLDRLRYRIDSTTLSGIISGFRYLFGSLIHGQRTGIETSALIRHYGLRDTPAEVQYWRSLNPEQLARYIAITDSSLRHRLFLDPTVNSLGLQQRQGLPGQYTQGRYSSQGSERETRM